MLVQIQVHDEIMKENYYALYLAIIAKKSVSKSCSEMGLTEKNPKNRKKKYHLSEEEIQNIIHMKMNKVTWREIAEKYKIPYQHIMKRVKEYMGTDWDNRGW